MHRWHGVQFIRVWLTPVDVRIATAGYDSHSRPFNPKPAELSHVHHLASGYKLNGSHPFLLNDCAVNHSEHCSAFPRALVLPAAGSALALLTSSPDVATAFGHLAPLALFAYRLSPCPDDTPASPPQVAVAAALLPRPPPRHQS